MATKPMQLKCKITLNDDLSYKVVSQMFDGTQFDLLASEYDFKTNEPFLPSKRTVDGWLYVQQESQQSSRVSITLPKPSVIHGHNLTVHELSLMPRHATIADFGGEKKSASESVTKVVADTVDAVKMSMNAPIENPPAGPNTGKSGKVVKKKRTTKKKKTSKKKAVKSG
jgi:hypothetical protein